MIFELLFILLVTFIFQYLVAFTVESSLKIKNNSVKTFIVNDFM